MRHCATVPLRHCARNFQCRLWTSQRWVYYTLRLRLVLESVQSDTHRSEPSQCLQWQLWSDVSLPAPESRCFQCAEWLRECWRWHWLPGSEKHTLWVYSGRHVSSWWLCAYVKNILCHFNRNCSDKLPVSNFVLEIWNTQCVAIPLLCHMRLVTKCYSILFRQTHHNLHMYITITIITRTIFCQY